MFQAEDTLDPAGIDLDNPPPTLSTGVAARLTGCARGTLWAAARDDGGIVVGDEVIRPIKVGRALRWPTRPILVAVGLISRRAGDGGPEEGDNRVDLTAHQVQSPPHEAA